MARPTRMDGEFLRKKFESSESANSDIFSSDVTPSYNPALIRMQVTLRSSAKVLVHVKDGSGTTHTSALNEDSALTAGAMEEFSFQIADPWVFNLQLGSAVTIDDLLMWEDDGRR